MTGYAGLWTRRVVMFKKPTAAAIAIGLHVVGYQIRGRGWGVVGASAGASLLVPTRGGLVRHGYRGLKQLLLLLASLGSANHLT